MISVPKYMKKEISDAVVKETYSRKGPLALLFVLPVTGIVGTGVYFIVESLAGNPPALGIGVMLVVGGGLFFLGQNVFRNATDCYSVALTQDSIIGKAPFRTCAIRYVDIRSIDVTPLVSDRIRITGIDGSRVCLDGFMRELGDLMETLLPLAVNIVHIELGKLTSARADYRRIWGKEPDWEILEAAQGRVRENQKSEKLQ
jgi:hypothetical protein